MSKQLVAPPREVLDTLKQKYEYRPITGQLIGRNRGRPVGSGGKSGYVYISVPLSNRRIHTVLLHHAAYYMMLGCWPKYRGEIDHINRDGFDCRWENLRAVTPSLQLFNRVFKTRNKSGARGVFVERSGKYSARIVKDGKHFWLGAYDTLEDAVRKRREAELMLYGEHAPIK